MALGEKVVGVSLERNTPGNDCGYLALICLLDRHVLVYERLAGMQNKNRLFDLSDGGVFMMRYLLFIVIGLFCSGTLWAEIARTVSGKPDLSGFYNTNMLIPLERPSDYGEEKYMTEEQSKGRLGFLDFLESSNEKSDPNRGAPAKGGDGNNAAGAGGVGGYNAFYIDPGTELHAIDGKIRNSIIYDPPNGRRPDFTSDGQAKVLKLAASFIHDNDGTASWLSRRGGGPGPFDGPETLALSERCLLGFDGAAPALPSLYNNYKRIIQTEDHVMILFEMVHDARIIKMDGEHNDQSIRDWQGDSVGRWEGDTLVVETKNFTKFNGLMGADENLQLTERFTLREDGDILYDFTVDDPTAWMGAWSGDYLWKATDGKVYEYACHEGNYSMGNILRGARILESEYKGMIPDANEEWYQALQAR